jgi:hypothetical protein
MEEGGVAITLLEPVNPRSLTCHNLFPLKEFAELPFCLLLFHLILHSQLALSDVT